ncbi:MAG: Na(+)-translocating NADH-quinone reductase subunit F [Flavobacteriaceae bacterium]
MKALSIQELHNLAMNIVGKQLEADGYEFLGVNSKPKSNPQFVCLKAKQMYFIVVRNVPYPEDPTVYDIEIMDKVRAHAINHEALTFYAGVGLSNASDRNLPVYLNEPYIVDYDGLIAVN